jgi:hypothetical protein
VRDERRGFKKFKRFKQFYLVEKCSYRTSVFGRYRRRQDRSDAIVVTLSGLTSLIVIAPGSPMIGYR